MKTLFKDPQYKLIFEFDNINDEKRKELHDMLIQLKFTNITLPDAYYYNGDSGDVNSLLLNEIKRDYSNFIKNVWIEKVQSCTIATSSLV